MNIPAAAMFLALVVPASSAGADELKPPREVSSVGDRVLAARPGDSLFFVVGDRITIARIDRGGINSRGIHLQLAGARMSGEVGGQRVALDLGPRGVAGHIGASEVSLEVARGDAFLNVEGRFGARRISLHLSPVSVAADVGPCRYSLQFQRNEYAGQVSCGSDPEPVHMRVPATLVARGDVELAALITSLLAR
jgi:hypothetical protein